ncbi:uncharacterized protein B0H64DRAFT_433438 [Chaetomium fimeti]|uniref:Uncharacterized protein n=1 Tax=Chaetomium fimeti TaxID=1854472 RepID=A0AAE0HCZ0_9PEZI|nr:hypothetical protein B0H64DRAFT_433438 [Chaetomium fimeti]
MVQVPIILLAAVGCLLSPSSMFASGSPLVPTERDVGSAGSYTFVEGPVQWRGTLEEGKEPVYLSGDTFEDIEAKAKALNPTYTIFDNSSVALEARDGLNTRATIHCGWPPSWSPTRNFLALAAGVEYLRGIKGDCRGRPGPGTCDRVSCSWDSAIYFCNGKCITQK